MVEIHQNQQLSLLIHLLDDPDQEVYNEVSREIFNVGPTAVDVLEDAWFNSNDELHKKRIEELIHAIQFQVVYTNFEKWCQSGCVDLMQGFLIASGVKYPNLNAETVLHELDLLTRNVWIELNENHTAIEKVKILNHVLFEMYGVGGEITDINHPESFFLNNLVQTWRGNAISIGLLYAIIAEKLQLPIKCVNLPGNFITCYTHEKSEIASDFKHLHPAKFYINPLAGGAIFTHKEITLYLEKALINPDESCFSPASNAEAMYRWFNDLLSACNLRGELSFVGDIKKLIKLLRQQI